MLQELQSLALDLLLSPKNHLFLQRKLRAEIQSPTQAKTLQHTFRPVLRSIAWADLLKSRKFKLTFAIKCQANALPFGGGSMKRLAEESKFRPKFKRSLSPSKSQQTKVLWKKCYQHKEAFVSLEVMSQSGSTAWGGLSTNLRIHAIKPTAKWS